MNIGYLYQIIFEVLGQLPIYLAELAAIIVALIYWRRYTRASVLTVLAVALLFISSVVLNLNTVMVAAERSYGLSFETIRYIILGTQLFHSAIRALSLILLLVAIFGWRSHEPK
jgi:hypothetical protein